MSEDCDAAARNATPHTCGLSLSKVWRSARGTSSMKYLIIAKGHFDEMPNRDQRPNSDGHSWREADAKAYRSRRQCVLRSGAWSLVHTHRQVCMQAGRHTRMHARTHAETHGSRMKNQALSLSCASSNADLISMSVADRPTMLAACGNSTAALSSDACPLPTSTPDFFVHVHAHVRVCM